LESAACGTSFVAADVGGVSEIADSNTDTLFPAGDDLALQDAVIAKLSDPTVPSRQQATYDVHSFAGRITEILERL
jgi:glycosyltransferase involved in cell wall biosynthesis